MGLILYCLALGAYLGYLLHDKVREVFGRVHALEAALVGRPAELKAA